MENMFENAKFGDKFVTLDDKIVVYYSKFEKGEYNGKMQCEYVCIVDNPYFDDSCFICSRSYDYRGIAFGSAIYLNNLKCKLNP